MPSWDDYLRSQPRLFCVSSEARPPREDFCHSFSLCLLHHSARQVLHPPNPLSFSPEWVPMSQVCCLWVVLKNLIDTTSEVRTLRVWMKEAVITTIAHRIIQLQPPLPTRSPPRCLVFPCRTVCVVCNSWSSNSKPRHTEANLLHRNGVQRM